MHKLLASFLALLLVVLPCTAQQQPAADKLLVPAGATLSVVLTEQVSSTATHSGDQIHVQLVSPVVSGEQVAIPAGTYLQGTVNRISQQNDSVSLSLYAVSLAFVNGYVHKLSGPVELRSAEGWWRPAPNSHRGAALIPFLFAPGIGAGIGAAAGKDAVLTPGSISGGQLIPATVKPETRGKDALIGFGIGAAIMAVGVAVYASSRHHGAPDFFFPAGAPMEIVLASAVSLDSAQVTDAINRPQAQLPPRAQLPQPASVLPPDLTISSGLCPAPDIPGTPATVIPGTPAIGDSPGTPDIVIPGTPATPGGMVPCT